MFVADWASFFLHYNTTSFEKTANYKGTGFMSFGAIYTKQLHKHIALQSGVIYARHCFTSTSASVSAVERNAVPFKFSMTSVPSYAKVSFFKYFFAQAGISINIGTGSDTYFRGSSGIGFDWGISAEITIKNCFRMFLYPYMHNFCPKYNLTLKNTPYTCLKAV